MTSVTAFEGSGLLSTPGITEPLRALGDRAARCDHDLEVAREQPGIPVVGSCQTLATVTYHRRAITPGSRLRRDAHRQRTGHTGTPTANRINLRLDVCPTPNGAATPASIDSHMEASIVIDRFI